VSAISTYVRLGGFNISSWTLVEYPFFPCVVNIQTESAYPPERLFPEAVRVMREKISVIKIAALTLKVQLEGTADEEMAEA